jgi:hypothetical protein
MVIDDFNVVCFPVSPNKTQTILIVDANAMLALAISGHGFQTVSRRRPKIFQAISGIKLRNLLQSRSAKVCRNPPTLAGIPQQLRIGVREALDHIRSLTHFVMNGKRY